MAYEIKPTSFVFTHEKLTPIVGRPTYQSVSQLKREVYANAGQNPCTLGGATRGYLGMVMPAAEYEDHQRKTNRPTVPFNFPPEPPMDATEAAIDHYTKITIDYGAMESALRRQIVEAVDIQYIKKFSDKIMGFGETAPHVFIDHLTKTYAKITLDDLLANNDKLKEKWDASEPIHQLWTRIDEIQEFASDGKQPISDAIVMQATLNVLKQTGVFATDIKIWEKTPAEQWTLDEFKQYFEDSDNTRETTTSKQAGYHTANNASDNKPKPKQGATTTTGTTATTTTTVDKSDPKYGTCMVLDDDIRVYYCWSHGGTTNSVHLSSTCTRPKDGHKRNATWRNMQGGSTTMNFTKANKIAAAEAYKTKMARANAAVVETDDNTN
jgi:hypothetical protein